MSPTSNAAMYRGKSGYGFCPSQRTFGNWASRSSASAGLRFGRADQEQGRLRQCPGALAAVEVHLRREEVPGEAEHWARQTAIPPDQQQLRSAAYGEVLIVARVRHEMRVEGLRRRCRSYIVVLVAKTSRDRELPADRRRQRRSRFRARSSAPCSRQRSRRQRNLRRTTPPFGRALGS